MTQHTPEALLDALKMMLRERKLSYSVIARAIDVSLPTIKRLLNKPTIPLSRLMEICELAEIPLADLIATAESLRPKHTIFTPQQDELFFRCPFIRSYFFELLNHQRTPTAIARKYKLNRSSTDLYLTQLEKVGLINRDPRGRVELLVSTPVGFGPGSKCLRAEQGEFMKSIVSQVVDGDTTTQGKRKRFAIMKPLSLHQKQFEQMAEELLAIVDRYSFLSESPAAQSASTAKSAEPWKLAIAAGSASESKPDDVAKIRNITRASLRKNVR